MSHSDAKCSLRVRSAAPPVTKLTCTGTRNVNDVRRKKEITTQKIRGVTAPKVSFSVTFPRVNSCSTEVDARYWMPVWLDSLSARCF